MTGITPARGRRPLRFAAVGIANTAIDFALLFLLKAIGLPVLVANTASTGVALCFSFLANRSFTFHAPENGTVAGQAWRFLAVTLIGLWGLQPLILLLLEHPLATLFAPWAGLLIAKAAATLVSLIWNYLMYSRFVFKQQTER